MSRFLHRLGGSAARHPWRVVAAWAAAAVVVLGLAGAFGGALNDDYTIPGTSSQRANDLLGAVPGLRRRRRPGRRPRRPGHPRPGRPRRRAASLSTAVDHASQVAPPVVSRDGATAILTVQYDVPVTDFKDDAGLTRWDAADDLTDRGYQVEFGGQMPENVALPAAPPS